VNKITTNLSCFQAGAWERVKSVTKTATQTNFKRKKALS